MPAGYAAMIASASRGSTSVAGARTAAPPVSTASSPNGLSSTLTSTIAAPAWAARRTTCHGRLVCAEQLRSLRHAGAHQKAAVGAALDG